MKTIQVQIKTVYGQEMIYPVCETAKFFAALAQQKTLTKTEINLIKNQGYTIEVVSQKQTL